MQISIYLSDRVLAVADAKAASMGLKRSAYLAFLVERDTVAKENWSFGFEQTFFPLSPTNRALADEWFSR